MDTHVTLEGAQGAHTASDTLELAYRMARDVARSGGSTRGRDGSTPESGFVVARGTACYRLAPHDAPGLVRALGTLLAARRRHAWFGAWLHDGELHVEPVEVVPDRETAVRLGRERAQHSVFDLSTGAEVVL